jgi:PAS domain S-box-containing protein
VSEQALRNRLLRVQRQVDLLEAMIEDRAREIYRANEKLRVASEFLEEVYRSMPGALLVFSAGGTIEAVNESALQLLEYRESELVGQPAALIFDDAGSGLEALHADVDEPQTLRCERVCRTRSGKSVPVLFSATARREGGMGADGSHGAVCVALDIRERKRLELELRGALASAQRELIDRQRAEEERERLREQLLHSQKLEAIGTLAGGVAHDMNNILAAILGLAEILRDGVRSDLQVDLDQVVQAAERGSSLTRNLLGFSRRGKYRKEELALADVVTGAATLLSRTLPKGIQIVTRTSGVPRVEGDGAQLSQAVINLCLNASDAMSGSGRLRIEAGEAALSPEQGRSLGVGSGAYATLSVVDDGSGMTREVQARMFEPFFTTKEPGRGTGLGLAMVYGTVRSHGGAVGVDSEPGRGTSITLYLPSVAARSRAEVVTRPATRRRGTGLLLLVDDEPMVRSVTRRSLERAGYQVLTAEHGAEALERFADRRDDISLVVLDMAMPVMGGAECFRRLRELDPGLRVLLASGYALEHDARQCLEAGALGFLEKPFASDRLLEAVAVALEGRDHEGDHLQPARELRVRGLGGADV